MKKLIYLIIPVIIGGIFTIGLNIYLDYKIDKLLSQKDVNSIKNEFGSDVKDKGKIVNKHLLKEDNIMILGSSELEPKTKQHPNYYFNTNKSKNGAFIVGKQFNQDLQAATILGSIDKEAIKGKKVVLLFSMQWFLGKDGMKPSDFQTRFSPTQFYAYLNNPDIDKSIKDDFATRTAQLLEGTDQYQAEKAYAELYTGSTIVDKSIKVLLYPYFKGREYMVSLKEKGTLYNHLSGLSEKKERGPIEKIDWKKEYENALVDGKKRSDKNDMKIDNDYYNIKFKDGKEKYKNTHKNADLINSKEIEDYKLFLETCEDLEVKPEIVIMPGMNWFYNYIGVSKEKRFALYDKASELAKEKGFDIIDLRNNNETPYYLRDPAHLGTKGWVDVCEKLFNKYEEQ